MKKLLVVVLIALTAFAAFAQGAKEPAKAEPEMILNPKLISAWFDPYEKDGIAAGKEYGAKVYFSAGAAANEAEQVRILEDAINTGVNALLVVPNDANSLIPTFRKARERGIVVLTHESPNQPEGDFDIEMIDNVKFGERFIDEFVNLTGSTEGEYAIFVGSLTVPAHNIWADAAIAYAKQKYPGLKLVGSKFPVSEDRNAARQQTLELLQVYPNLKGILGFGSQGGPGAAQALREAGRTTDVKVLCTTSPLEASPFLSDDSIDLCILWSSGDAARAMVYVAKTILDGNRNQIKQGFEIPGLGQPTIDGMNLIFDFPLIVDKTNSNQYNF